MPMNKLKVFRIFFDSILSFYSSKTPRYMPIVYFNVTQVCNARCKMCAIWKMGPLIEKQELDITEVETVIKYFKKLGCLVVSLLGGEPLIRKDIYKIISLIDSAGMTAHMETNGILLDKEAIIELQNSGLQVISVSLDSHRAEVHNFLRGAECFDKVLTAIRQLKQVSPSISVLINTVVNKKNIDDLICLYRLASQLKVDGIKLHLLRRNDVGQHSNAEDIKDLIFDKEDIPRVSYRMKELIAFDRKYKLLKNSYFFLENFPYFLKNAHNKNRCFAGIATCVVMPYGDVSCCYNFQHQGMSIGNLRELDFISIWQSESFRSARNKARKCSIPCWDACTKEPSLRLNPYFIARNLRIVLNELRLFLGKK